MKGTKKGIWIPVAVIVAVGFLLGFGLIRPNLDSGVGIDLGSLTAGFEVRALAKDFFRDVKNADSGAVLLYFPEFARAYQEDALQLLWEQYGSLDKRGTLDLKYRILELRLLTEKEIKDIVKEIRGEYDKRVKPELACLVKVKVTVEVGEYVYVRTRSAVALRLDGEWYISPVPVLTELENWYERYYDSYYDEYYDGYYEDEYYDYRNYYDDYYDYEEDENDIFDGDGEDL